MSSIWTKTTEMPHYSPLERDINADAVVIGGGMAGILTAYFLQKKGLHVIVLESENIGSGQTKNTSAKITCQHNLIYHSLIQNFGEEKARQYATANQLAIAEFARIVKQEKIACDFKECPSYLYSTTQGDMLEAELKAALSLGIKAELTTQTELPFEINSALKFEGQAQFHPLKFLKAIARSLEIYGNTKVKSVDENGVTTDKFTVTAEHIIFATHFPFLNAPGYYFMRMHQERSYLLALENAAHLDGVYLSIDEDGLSLRCEGDMLLLGGGAHRTGENSEGGKYQQLRNSAKKYFSDSSEVAAWSAQDCIPLDGVPYIGQFSAATPNWYVATGFGKWGMTSSMVSAMIISDMILGIENPFSEVFSPQRFKPSASAKELMENTAQATKGLIREIFTAPILQIEELPCGHGGILEYDGNKVGVYKNEQGETFIVSARCPHLGCQLEWNPDELSWDCPCHGSRFDYIGKLIDNPAQEDLEYL